VTEQPVEDVERLQRWCKRHGIVISPLGSSQQREAIAERSMEEYWASVVEDDPQAFAADVVAEHLLANNQTDLLLDLWLTFVPPLAFIGPPPGSAPALDLRTLSYFAEQGIDTSNFSPDSLLPPIPADRARQAKLESAMPEERSSGKGLFGRLFGR
jgi:hypothetical protein